MKNLEPEKWVDRYADYLYNYTIVRVNDHVIAQEIISETFFAALKAQKNFKGKSSERTWLTAILKRKVIDYYRKMGTAGAQAEVPISHFDYDENDWVENPLPDLQSQSIEDAIENEELRLAILDCLSHLNEKQAEIFSMRTIEGIDTETICKELDISASNLWVIIHRARKSMMECLEKKWFN